MWEYLRQHSRLPQADHGFSISDYGLLGDDTGTANLQSNIVSVLQAGCFVGALAGFPLPDIMGRKWCLVGAAVFTMAGVVMQAAASGHLEAMYIGRFISGKIDRSLTVYSQQLNLYLQVSESVLPVLSTLSTFRKTRRGLFEVFLQECTSCSL
jgi:MFS family permease